MKAFIEKKIRFVDNNVDYIDVQTTIYFLGLPIYWQSKKFVPPIGDDDMSVTKRMYKERVTDMTFRESRKFLNIRLNIRVLYFSMKVTKI